MSKFAPVCPIRMYKHMQDRHPNAMGDYFLLLAHDVIDKPLEYAEVFINREYTTIMDNSVVELGDSVLPEVLIEACRIVGAHVLAIPDALMDGPGTIEASRNFMSNWEKTENTPNPEFMFIPQGKDIDEYEDCLRVAAEYGIPMDWIGIARNTIGPVVSSRMEIIDVLAEDYPGSKLHLLGFSDNTWDDMMCAQSALVQGIDSAVPVRTHQIINAFDTIEDPGPRYDWWDNGELTHNQVENINSIRRQIEV